MIKLFIAFAVFAAIALYVIFKAGDKVDMSGEKHDMGGSHPPAASAPAATPASAAASK